jgi:hypothetical protein
MLEALAEVKADEPGDAQGGTSSPSFVCLRSEEWLTADETADDSDIASSSTSSLSSEKADE